MIFIGNAQSIGQATLAIPESAFQWDAIGLAMFAHLICLQSISWVWLAIKAFHGIPSPTQWADGSSAYSKVCTQAAFHLKSLGAAFQSMRVQEKQLFVILMLWSKGMLKQHQRRPVWGPN